MSGSNRVAIRGVLINYVQLAVAFASTFVLTPIIIGKIGQSAYGLWSIYYSLISYFLLFDFGLNIGIAKFTSEFTAKGRPEYLNRLISSTITIMLVLGGLAVLTGFVLSPWIPGIFKVPSSLVAAAQSSFRILALNILLLLFSGVLGNIIYGLHRVDVWKGGNILQLCTNTGLAITFLYLGFGLRGLTSAYLTGSILLLFVYLAYLRKNHPQIHIRPAAIDREILKDTLPYSLRTFLLGITNKLINYKDYILLGILLGPATVAPYEIAHKLCFLATYSFSVISSAAFPKYSAMYASNNLEDLRVLYIRICKASLAIMSAIAIFLCFYGKDFIGLWVGSDNFAGKRILFALILMDFLHAIGTPAVALLQGIGKNKKFLYSELVNGPFNLLLSLLLVRKVGVVGVVLGTMIAGLCTSGWIVPFLSCRYIGLSFRKYIQASIVNPLVSCLATGMIVWWFRPYMLSPTGYASLAANGVIIFAINTGLFAFLGCSRVERTILLGYARTFVGKIIPAGKE